MTRRLRRPALLAPALFALGLLALALPAQAHLLPKQNATLNIVERSIFMVVSVPVSALIDVDDDQSGSLSGAEIERHQSDLQSQFNARFQVEAADNPVQAALTMAMSPNSDGEQAASDYVVFMHRVNFAAEPTQPRISTDLFGSGDGESRMTISARQGEQSQVAILEAGASSHQFFRGGWALLVDFTRIGALHIWEGPDHLLFLLTVLVAGAGWRYWLAVISAFTVAHSITLTLSALDLARLPAGVVEPGIAASIVLMAVLSLSRSGRATTGVSRKLVAIVFACGLLHGFGFASAVGAMAVDSSSRLYTLVGFNLGLEIGQLAFVAAVLLLVAAVGRLGAARLSTRLPRAASVAAAVLGGVLLVQQLGQLT